MKAKTPAPARKAPPRVLKVNPLDRPASIELLNSVALFEGRIKFTWIRRRGSLIQAGFTNGRQAQWFSATDLRTFSRSQDILYDATDFLIQTPAQRNGIKNVWEPVSQLIRDISNADAVNLEAPLKDEFESIIRTTWIRAGRPYANDAEEFYAILRKCQRWVRNEKAEAPPVCCVWAGGNGESSLHHVWIYQETFIDWLSTPMAKRKYYPWDDVRKALMMLDFETDRPHLSRNGESVKVRVWKGPLSLLIDDETGQNEPFPVDDRHSM